MSPALDRYTNDVLANGLWKRPGLSSRDRSIATLSVVIAQTQATLIPDQIRLALDNGVTPTEVSEIITHLAFYGGWGKAITATSAAKDVFAEHEISALRSPRSLLSFQGPIVSISTIGLR